MPLEPLHFANKPIHKPGYHLLGRRNPLPEGWVEDYHRALQALSKTDTSSPQGREKASELERYLDGLEGQSKRAGRGAVYRPQPDSMGIYPSLHAVPLDKVKTAIRANSPGRTRAIAWGEVAKSAEPFQPGLGESVRMKRHNNLDALQQRHFMEAIAVAVPMAKGREPHFLGEKVPGELTLGPTGTASIIGGTNMSSSDWSRGFTAMKFSMTEKATKLGEWALNHKKTVGALAAASAVGPSLITTPGFHSGYKRGKSGSRLSDSEVVRNRLIPGYTDGYDRGRRRVKEGYEAQETRAYYELGFQYGIKDFWNSFTSKMHGNVGPTLLRGAYVHGLGKLHQEIGLPPTTVDGIPVQRRSLNSVYGPYSTNELLMARSGLQKHLESNQGDAETTQRAIEDLTKEVIMRRNLSSV